MSVSRTPFVGEFAWATLDPDTQAIIGAAALELGAALFTEAVADPDGPACRAAAAAIPAATLQMLTLFEELTEEGLLSVEEEEPYAWRLPAVAGPVCRDCGGSVPSRREVTCTLCSEPDYEDMMALIAGDIP